MRWLANATAFCLFALGITRALFPVQACVRPVFGIRGGVGAVVQATLYWPWQHCSTGFPRPEAAITAVQAAVLLIVAAWVSWQRTSASLGR